MKKSFLSIFLVATTLFLFTQCKKDDAAPTTATTTVNYSPLTTGSSWTYNYTEGNAAAVSYTYTVTDKDTTINGKTYNVLSSSDGSENKYMAKIDSNYYRYASFSGIGSFEELYLKDNRDVNSTWTGLASISYAGVPISANLTYTVKEKGISYLVNGKTYNDVIHIRLDADALSISIGGGDFYYAKDIGLIENNIKLTYLGQSFTTSQQLTAYVIK